MGGFGGCSHSVLQALRGEIPEAFTEAFQSSDPSFAALTAQYRTDADDGKGSPIDYAGELAYLSSVGLAGLDNGLAEGENNTLSTSKNLPEIVYLILKGLSQSLK